MAWGIRCTACDASVPCLGNDFGPWNRRAATAALAASPEVQALIREAEARGMEQAYRKACVAVQIVISRNTPDDGGDADPCLVDQLEAVESLIKREAAALRGEKEPK